MKRRHFLWLLLAAPFVQAQKRQRDDADNTLSRFIASRMLQKALSENWSTLPIGVLMCRFGELFLGTLYDTGTLETPTGEERCRVDFTGVDCFTFVEATLCLARTLKLGNPTYEGFLNQVLWTRYRNGQMTDYTSRLHYTADWLYDNERRGVLRNITPELGGKPFKVQVSYMSRHPQRYPALRARPELIPEIARIEQLINARQHWYIPRHEVAAVLPQLRAGDIIAFATSRAGLDYAHLGLVYPAEDGVRLLHASQTARKVIVDKPIDQYLAAVSTHIGITIARPLEVG
jgi:hypothetical protein